MTGRVYLDAQLVRDYYRCGRDEEVRLQTPAKQLLQTSRRENTSRRERTLRTWRGGLAGLRELTAAAGPCRASSSASSSASGAPLVRSSGVRCRALECERPASRKQPGASDHTGSVCGLVLGSPRNDYSSGYSTIRAPPTPGCGLGTHHTPRRMSQLVRHTGMGTLCVRQGRGGG